MENIKKCQECQSDFQSITRTGSEQKYCSHKCRNKAATKRNNQKILDKIKRQINDEKAKQTDNVISGDIGKDAQGNDRVQWSDNTLAPTRIDSSNDVIRLLERNFETKSEALQYQLKYEAALKEIDELNRRIAELEMEFDEDDEDSNDGMIGQIMTSFKQDPVNTVSFASAMIKEFFKTPSTPTPTV